MKVILRRIVHGLPLPLQKVVRWLDRTVVLRLKTLTNASLKKHLFGDQEALVPPLYQMEDGPQDYETFKRSGELSFSLLTNSAGLRPTDRVLDIGSGLGRQIRLLLPWMSTGSYEGLEPITKQVEWCRTRITPRYHNFRFQPIDVWSKLYNPDGKTKPQEYIFPFPDNEFDFVMLNSVFTHMFAPDIRHYLSEISRVLRPGGRCMISYFLLNEESEKMIAMAKSAQNLVYPAEEGSKADNPHRLETAIGHVEKNILEMYKTFGLEARVGEHGSWCGRTSKYFQDIVLAFRP